MKKVIAEKKEIWVFIPHSSSSKLWKFLILFIENELERGK